MKKLLIFLFVAFYSFQSFAQDPELFDTWYLTDYYIDPGGGTLSISDIDPPIEPTFVLTETLEFSGIGACNTFSGEMSHDSIDQIFTITNSSSTNGDCGFQQHNTFEIFYFNMLAVSNSQLQYDLTIFPNGVKFLRLTDMLQNILFFSNISFPDPEIFQTWYLSRIEYNSGDILWVSEITPEISPNLIIDPTFDFNGNGACNGFGGTFIYDELDKTLTATDYNETLLECEYQDHNIFEGEYFPYFSNEIPLTYVTAETGFGDLYLALRQPNTEFFVVFQNVPLLSIEDFNSNNFTIYPNPIKDLLKIGNTSNTEITSIKLYDTLGRLIMTKKGDVKEVDVSHLNSDLFILKIETDKGVLTKKVIKE